MQTNVKQTPEVMTFCSHDGTPDVTCRLVRTLGSEFGFWRRRDRQNCQRVLLPGIVQSTGHRRTNSPRLPVAVVSKKFADFPDSADVGLNGITCGLKAVGKVATDDRDSEVQDHDPIYPGIRDSRLKDESLPGPAEV
ncbi:hypothetical protein Bbelb_205060 [Branchiostoma belcheri]|nr:hypothetical protein Bbelb_205060 [Branchiostoma belcheri]